MRTNNDRADTELMPGIEPEQYYLGRVGTRSSGRRLTRTALILGDVVHEKHTLRMPATRIALAYVPDFNRFFDLVRRESDRVLRGERACE